MLQPVWLIEDYIWLDPLIPPLRYNIWQWLLRFTPWARHLISACAMTLAASQQEQTPQSWAHEPDTGRQWNRRLYNISQRSGGHDKAWLAVQGIVIP
ncbi:MAG: hypothetical protein DBP00_17950 [gamma proteobacterium symbiont of Ctena orbiculata]|nr:MAG: hypothetical protein DBP00_17950 [gamma proteobacterium symbiont of Ctena orbiculata]